MGVFAALCDGFDCYVGCWVIAFRDCFYLIVLGISVEL